MQTGRIHERDFTHTDDTYFRFIADDFHHIIKFVRYTEEERTVDFINFNSLRQKQYFFIMAYLPVIGQVDFVFGY